ncbi:MAG: F0F1 ATP synthase subunit A [Bacteroidales bacterium]|nr:F0F1 ATP synthase subunit A [Bacteroidales bacterium]
MNRLLISLTLALALIAWPLYAAEPKGDDETLEIEEAGGHEEETGINPKEIIFEHLGDNYGWEIPFSHTHRIPLPCIVRAKDGVWYCFMSNKVQSHEDGLKFKEYDAGDGVIFTIAGPEDPHKDKIVQVIKNPDGTVEYYRPRDISITKNVAALWISVILVAGLMLWLAGWYRRKGNKAPRKGLGAIEVCVSFVYDGVIKPTLKENTPRFAPYLMTVFFFILGMNLLGLIVIFPGGANLTGNIAVTLVLAVLTFLITNIFGTKEYWKEIFWPDVPLWLKCPLPIMPLIEVFGMFTKPAALTVRLFANMMGGHMIVIVLTLLIFIFYLMSPAIGGVVTVISIIFSVFMLVIDVLVSFIQAYVFTMLSTIFISLAQVKGHEHKHESVGKAIEEALV